jgi:hypothetical protein
MRTSISAFRFVLALLFMALVPISSMAISKTIIVNPKIPVNAVTTWYYANCTTSAGIGSYSVITAPMHGTVSFGQLNAPLPGCSAGSPSLPAVAAFYDWTDTTIPPPASDFFSLLYQAPDGETEEEDITVELPACAIGVETLATVPGIDNDSRINLGVGESVRLTTNIPVTWSITSGPLEALTDGTVPVEHHPFGERFPSEECSAETAEPVVGNEACFKAPYTNGTTVISATGTGGEGTCSVTLTTVEPQGLIFQRIQYPSLASPDYKFSNDFGFGVYFNIEMESAIFVAPGNVSFANIHFKELDQPGALFGFEFNSLYDVAGTNAWLLSCDHDHQYGESPVASSRTDQWIWTDWDDAHVTPFATEETSWSVNLTEDLPYGEAHFSKGQTAVFGPDGTLIPTPGAPAATLNVPAVNFNDFRGVGDHKECETQLGVDFTPLQ